VQKCHMRDHQIHAQPVMSRSEIQGRRQRQIVAGWGGAAIEHWGASTIYAGCMYRSGTARRVPRSSRPASGARQDAHRPAKAIRRPIPPGDRIGVLAGRVRPPFAGGVGWHQAATLDYGAAGYPGRGERVGPSVDRLASGLQVLVKRGNSPQASRSSAARRYLGGGG